MSAFTVVGAYEVRGFPSGSGHKLVVGTATGTASYDATTGSVLDLSPYFSGSLEDVQCEALGLLGYQGAFVAGTGPSDGAIYLFEGQATGGAIVHGAEVTTTEDLHTITFQFAASGTDG